ncbi:phosphoribosylformylglycinamidine synthase I [Campylobacter sp. MIT 99-7217]|uniref:phosphoribosylformylglycinamidine synthase subunit PurQ n=1 Tax=Campylobacter sp. MIT 99-7217 TaxID=535091 RepID=UPI0011586690|nr:phosphoribosylformylglycinamidine synthase subunit PurQ [Campylobacter sp. MIT 99-7217]TQR33039.1 phosphoribosylformylglycinamidine synthase I [Campylobacter sp. MIT 99-7217]
MKIAIIQLPGVNCEFDTACAFSKLGVSAEIIWHERQDFSADLIVLPGGFSYGDYLRCGAIAKFSPAMKVVLEHAKKGGFILGICNGFQMLTELHLLKGTLLRNKNLNFIAKDQSLKIISNNNTLLKNFQKDELISLPIAHGEGNFYADESTLKNLQDKDLITLKYEDNPNGSSDDIAGICDEGKRIFGLMPHPERACDELLGSKIGLKMLKGFL